MHRIAALLLFCAPVTVYARGRACNDPDCGKLYLSIVFVGVCLAIGPTIEWVRKTIEKQRHEPGWLVEFLTACKRLFSYR